MHYRSTHSAFLSHRRTHTHIYVYTHSSFSSFHWISTHAHMLHHKWWDLNINSMKYSCVSASRSSRTNTKGDLPSDLRIPLHSSLSLSFPNSLSLALPCCVAAFWAIVTVLCTSVFLSIVLLFCDNAFLLSRVFCMSVTWRGAKNDTSSTFFIFFILSSKCGKGGWNGLTRNQNLRGWQWVREMLVGLDYPW